MSTKESVGFIGSGRIATILLGGWKRAATVPGKVVVFDVNPDVTAKLESRHPGVKAGSMTEAAGQHLVFLAVHPPVLGSVLPRVQPALRADAIVVSLAPKFTVAKLSELLGGFDRIARMIPNAPSIVGKGYNAVAFGEALGEGERASLRALFAGLGRCVEVPEAQLETYAVVTAMAVTFLWPQLELLASLAASSGLRPAAAWEGIEQMLLGAVAALRDSRLTSAEVQDLVPIRPVEEETNAFVSAARPKWEGLLAKLQP